METQLFHIFRNTPLGRETTLQSLHFCERTGVSPVIYIPRHIKFLIYFENDVVQVDLDESYLTGPDSAREHAESLLSEFGIEPDFFEPKNFTASTLPDVPTNFDFMCCPRTISDLSSKIGLGYIGPRVRRIVNSAHFPVLITSAVFRPWNSITVCFGGSSNAVNAFKLGVRIARLSGLPLDIFTHAEESKRKYEQILSNNNLEDTFSESVREWILRESRSLEENLYDIPRNALVVLGAYGHGLIKDIVFGNTVERIQAVIPNNLLMVGPKYAATS